MASATISKLGQFFRVVGKPGSVTVQTPAHVHDLGVPGDIDSTHIAMTVFAIQTCCDMRAMCEMDEIRDLRHRHPGDFFIIQNIVF
jgi:hypothetical protein